MLLLHFSLQTDLIHWVRKPVCSTSHVSANVQASCWVLGQHRITKFSRTWTLQSRNPLCLYFWTETSTGMHTSQSQLLYRQEKKCLNHYGEEKECVNWLPSSISYIEYTKLNKQENKLCYFMLKYSTNTQERLFSPRQTPNSNLLLPSTSTLLNLRTKPCRFSSSWIPQYCTVGWKNQSCMYIHGWHPSSLFFDKTT